jgi:hypothetical protein
MAFITPDITPDITPEMFYKIDSSGQCYITFYGRNYVAVGITQSKS